jgi:uncharacterized protein YjdB
MSASIAGTANVCVGQTTALTYSSHPGGLWSSSNSALATADASSGMISGVSSGTVTITYAISSGCTKTRALTVKSSPAAIAGASSVPMLGTTTLTNATTGGTWSSSSTLNATVSSAGVVTGVLSGTTTISYRLANGCAATREITVISSRPTTPTDEIAIHTWSMYPNPTNGALTIESGIGGTMSVFTVDGRQVATFSLQAGTSHIDLPKELASGTYLCRFTGADGTTTINRIILN